jgi:2-iminobutanoate/2-iminopropanoate deaminase|tara:strand:+ start:2428 stop:2823 length:396 start_codon:yes stop_codon:yes gene_type:complete
MLEITETENAPLPGGHYSQAVRHENTWYISGILPVSTTVDTLIVKSFPEQVKQVLANADAILSASGCSRDDVIKSTVYISDIAKWPEFDRLYAQFFSDHRPARAVIPVPTLHHGFDVEVEMIARVSTRESK